MSSLTVLTRVLTGALTGAMIGTALLVAHSSRASGGPALTLTPEMVKLAQVEAERVLEYSDREIAGGLEGDLTNSKLEEVIEIEPGMWTARIVSDAFYSSHDFDFGDPVDEIETVCRTDIEVRSTAQGFELKALKTVCDFNPWDNEGWIHDEP